jgi:predicted nucleic acid-binding Zn ribbon protein
VSAQELPRPRCTVCGTEVRPDARHCPSCGLYRPTATGRRVLARRAVWALGFLLLVVWVVTLAVVATAN